MGMFNGEKSMVCKVTSESTTGEYQNGRYGACTGKRTLKEKIILWERGRKQCSGVLMSVISWLRGLVICDLLFIGVVLNHIMNDLCASC